MGRIRCLIVAQAQLGAQLCKDQVLLCGHVLFRRQSNITAAACGLVIVGVAHDEYDPALFIVGLDRRKLICCIAVDAVSGGLITTRRSREDDCLELGVIASVHQLVLCHQLYKADAILVCECLEITHGIAVVSVDILIVVRAVQADVDKLAGIQHVQLDGLGEGVFLAVLLHHGGDGHGADAGLVGCPLEGDIQSAALSQRIAGLVGTDDGAADAVG